MLQEMPRGLSRFKEQLINYYTLQLSNTSQEKFLVVSDNTLNKADIRSDSSVWLCLQVSQYGTTNTKWVSAPHRFRKATFQSKYVIRYGYGPRADL